MKQGNIKVTKYTEWAYIIIVKKLSIEKNYKIRNIVFLENGNIIKIRFLVITSIFVSKHCTLFLYSWFSKRQFKLTPAEYGLARKTRKTNSLVYKICTILQKETSHKSPVLLEEHKKAQISCIPRLWVLRTRTKLK